MQDHTHPRTIANPFAPRATESAVGRLSRRNRQKAALETGLLAAGLMFAIGLGAIGMM